MSVNIAEILADIQATAAKKSAKVLKYAEMVGKLRAVGIVKEPTKYDYLYVDSMTITRDELPKVRQALGRLKMTGKTTAHDFDSTNEILVSVQPMNKDFPFTFVYRSKYRAGGKCRVVRNTYKPAAYESVSLVCDR